MLGAICGDLIGSIYERQNVKSKQIPLFSEKTRFTADTVLTDTFVRICGRIVEAYYGTIPADIVTEVKKSCSWNLKPS